jgi:hypothetical protein
VAAASHGMSPVGASSVLCFFGQVSSGTGLSSWGFRSPILLRILHLPIEGASCRFRSDLRRCAVPDGHLGPVVVQDKLQGPLCGNRRECVLSGEGSSCGAPVAPGDGFFCGCKLQPFQVPLVRRLMSRREYSPVANKPDQIIQRFSPDHPTNPPS